MDFKTFFDEVRGPLFKWTLYADQVSGCEFLIEQFEAARWPVGWAAYALATVKHETAHTMQPIAERGTDAYFKKMYDPLGSRPALARRNGNTVPGDGRRYRGRGYVQITWRSNYRRVGQKIGVDLESSPDLALVPEHAVRILMRGMAEGWFTGKKLADYINDSRADYVGARRIINGTDKAEEIAALALRFEAALRKAGYGAGPTKPRPVPVLPPDVPAAKPPAPNVAAAGFWSRLFSTLFGKSP